MFEIMDTTLRDGEQMRSVSYSGDEKLAIARMLLEDARVPRVEIASARVSEGEREAAGRVLDWARGKGWEDRIEMLGFVDRDKSAEWIASTGGKVVNLLAKGSERHARGQLGKTREEHLADILATIEYAERRGLSCNLYLEVWSSGMLESPDYVYFMLDGLVGAGLRRVFLPDTLGVLTPALTADMVGAMVERYPDTHFEFHGHDDYGMATANSLAAALAGARGAHCTVNGMGERAGNAALDEVVVCIHDHAGLSTGVDEAALPRLAAAVEAFSGQRLACNKPVTGANAFVQTAGIHADGDRKEGLYANRLLPERFGRKRAYALGKLAGKASLELNLAELGIELGAEQKSRVLARVIELGDRKEDITAEDLPYIVADVLDREPEPRFVLDACVVVSSKGMRASANLKARSREAAGGAWRDHAAVGQGDGGYDACMDAMSAIAAELGLELPELADFAISIPPGGRTDALVSCSISWRGERSFSTRGVHSDQVMAAMEATEKMLDLVLRFRGSRAGRAPVMAAS